MTASCCCTFECVFEEAKKRLQEGGGLALALALTLFGKVFSSPGTFVLIFLLNVILENE